jgi:acyl-CoA thioesterase II
MARITLLDTLKLERLEVNLFRGTSPDPDAGRIFGGHVIAQSLLAAYETVENRLCHSLHAYFIRPGDPKVPIIFDVDRSRDGGSFTTRRVVAIQHGQQIFNLAASFQAAEAGFEHQIAMPEVPAPEGLPDERAQLVPVMDQLPPEMQANFERPRPIDMRGVKGHAFLMTGPGEPYCDLWVRARSKLADNPIHHQVILAYISDMALLSTAMRPHQEAGNPHSILNASLDHALWFHRPFNVNEWLLHHMDSPSASGARGFNRGSFFTRDGVLVASTAQEGMIRRRRT